MKELLTWKTGLIAVAIFVVTAVVPGCLENIIKSDPPLGAESRTISGAAIPANASLAKTIRLRNAYVDQETAFISRWDEKIVESQEKLQMWEGVLSAVTSPDGLAAIGLSPTTGGISTGLFLLGLFTRRPGDQPKATAKQDSYNKGREDALALLKTIKDKDDGLEAPSNAQPSV